eukprot:31497-Pelagococcus_subviridis.AAC.44
MNFRAHVRVLNRHDLFEHDAVSQEHAVLRPLHGLLASAAAAAADRLAAVLRRVQADEIWVVLQRPDDVHDVIVPQQLVEQRRVVQEHQPAHEPIQELPEVPVLKDQRCDLLARERRAVHDDLHELGHRPELRGRKLRRSGPLRGVLVETVPRRASEFVLVHGASSHSSGEVAVRRGFHVVLRVRQLHGLDLLPDVVAPDGFLETQRDVRVYVRICPRDDRVPSLSLIDVLSRDSMHEQRLLVFLGHDD